jgi:hypothetical protein
VALRNGVGTRQRVDAGETQKADVFGCPSSSRTPHPNQYAVSDGRFAVGIVKVTASGFTAVDVAGRVIDTFSTLREAAAALPDGGAA